MTGLTLGRYRVGALLERGDMGEVYQAEDLELGGSVALDVLPDRSRSAAASSCATRSSSLISDNPGRAE